MDDFSYKLGDAGVVLNPNDAVMPFVDVVKITGLDSAELRVTERDHEGTDGGFLDAYFEKMRTVVLEGQVITDGSSTESYLDTLKSNWSPSRTSIPLYLQHPGVDERLVMVKPLGVRYDVDQLRRTGCADVQFVAQAEDPRVYSSELVTLPISQGGLAATGMGFPFAGLFGFGAVVAPATTNAFNGGNRPTPAVITIPGPVTVPRIFNDTTGDVLEFNITLGAADFLVVDTYYRTVKLNGTASRRGVLTNPDWFDLTPGDNLIRYQANTEGNPNASISYRYAWR